MSTSKPRIHVFARVLGAMLLAGLLTLTAGTLTVVLLVQDDKEATLVDGAMQLSAQRSDAVKSRIRLARAQLRSAAYAADADRLIEVPSAAEGTTSAVLGWRHDEEVFEAASSEGAVQRLREAPRVPAGELHIDGTEVVISAHAGDVDVSGLVPLDDLLTFPTGWTASIERDPSTPLMRATRTDSAIEILTPIEQGFVLQTRAPLEPARDAAFAISKRVIIASALVVLPLFLLAWLLSRGVTSPIRSLLRTVRESRTLPIEVPSLPNDEVGDLGDAIEQMSRRLHRDAGALQRALVLGRVSADDATSYLGRLQEELCAIAGEWQVLEAPLHLALLEGLGLDAAAVLTRVDDARRSEKQSEAIDLGPHGWGVSLHDGERDYGLAIARGVSPEDLRVAEVLTRTALSHLRNRTLERRAGIGEKLAMLSRLSASVAHEMNTPLAFVNANLLAVEDEPLNDDAKEMVADARLGVERIIRIVRDLSAVSAGGREASNEVVVVEELLRDMVRMARARRPEGVITVNADAEVCVEVDRGRLEQVVINLINNALDAAAGAVEVRAGRIEDTVVVDVVDDGPGIAAGVRGRLFEAFNTSKGAHGTGLGLYISRSLVEAHGGTLELVSSDSTGTTFRLTLPDAGVRDAQLPTTGGATRRPRLLVVDDDDAVVRSMKRWLKKRADIEGTTDAEEGLRLMTSQPFDLVLCDMNMPHLGGREMAETLRRDHPELIDKLVILTGSNSEPPEGVRVVRKPLDPRLADALLATHSPALGTPQ